MMRRNETSSSRREVVVSHESSLSEKKTALLLPPPWISRTEATPSNYSEDEIRYTAQDGREGGGSIKGPHFYLKSGHRCRFVEDGSTAY
jgi:hypothetical protein